MKEQHKIGVILLAAGASSRLGRAKQLLSFRGKFLLQQSIDLGEAAAFSTRILVLGARKDEILKKIDRRSFEVVLNDAWEDGMGTSISIGLSEALKRDEGLEHILILLTDQPLVNLEQVEKLISVQMESGKQASFSAYAGEVGVPAIFSRQVFPQLLQLEGDQGARKLVGSIKYNTVAFEKGNFDVDTPKDVELLKELEKE